MPETASSRPDPSRPLVSVIIPAYNEEASLAQALESLSHQTYPNLEALVVDDGSTDETPEIAARYPVRLIRSDHRGPGAARNRGAREARGEILVFVDADMLLDADFVEQLTRPIRQGDALGTFTTEEFVANPTNRWARCWSLNQGLPPDRRLPRDHPPYSTIFRAVGRDRFLSVGGFTEDIGYTDDDTLADKLGGWSVAATGAICYHQNPPTLGEVFRQARWIGRSSLFAGRPLALAVYSPPVSLFRGLAGALRAGEPSLLPFKLVYDLGILCGILSRNMGQDGGRHAK